MICDDAHFAIFFFKVLHQRPFLIRITLEITWCHTGQVGESLVQNAAAVEL